MFTGAEDRNESAVWNLLSCLQRHSNTQAHGNAGSPTLVAPQAGTSGSGVGQAVSKPNTVQQEMQR